MKEIKKINQQKDRAVLEANDQEIISTTKCCRKSGLKAKYWP